MKKWILVGIIGALIASYFLYPSWWEKRIYWRKKEVKGAQELLSKALNSEVPPFPFSQKIKDLWNKLKPFLPIVDQPPLSPEELSRAVKEKIITISYPELQTSPGQNIPFVTSPYQVFITLSPRERIKLTLKNPTSEQKEIIVRWHKAEQRIVLPPSSEKTVSWSWATPGIYKVETSPPTQTIWVKVIP